MGSLTDAARFLNRIEKASTDGDEELKWPLWIAFVVSYAKPFTKNNDMGKISDRAVPAELKHLHRAFIKARDHAYGHTDPLEILEDGFQANQVHLRKSGRSIDVVPMSIAPHDEEIPNAKRLVAAIRRDLHTRTEKGRALLNTELTGKPDDDYVFPYPKLSK